VNGFLTIIHLTIHEARRRRILLAALLGGLATVLCFGIGIHFVDRDLARHADVPLIQRRMILTTLTMAGLFAVKFLVVMTSVLLPVDTLSGEITSGVMQTLASKPIRRSDIVLGKWMAHALILAGYVLVVAGGVVLVARLVCGVMPPRVPLGISLMLLQGLVLLSLSIAGGSRLSTIANGLAVFSLEGIAFVGSWIEQIGTMVGNDAARYIGTAASLIMPGEAMWQLAEWHMQPPLLRELHMTPFSPASVPNGAMVLWAVGYLVVTLMVGLRSFARRGL
jgi:ABC-type transport system involved in multi-copper enzyme maturation permease subunit